MFCILCAILGFVCKVLKKKRQSFENVCKQLKNTVSCVGSLVAIFSALKPFKLDVISSN